ncbi:acyl carrier protein [Janthinobacterium fluminis]|uniref:Acyl carrier protein n=1 Tax=Janthinobacterium fluminis TaxID=2987524 RepID=A0ABT5K0B7_9BURK|nr:acyl carrier protein [Janthinobacterium fluminis]MDC8758294.1 acyl carrier protein [Janthinobacterium fluminis]
MTTLPVLDTLTELFRDVFDDDAIVLTAATTADDVPAWDSLNHISLLVAAEMRFGVKFRTAEMENLKNVGELAALIARLLAQKT